MGLLPTPTSGQPQGAMQEPQDERFTNEDDSNVSPEEQAQYTKFEENYMRMIYTPDGEVNPEVLENLSKPAPVPPEMQGEMARPEISALATTAVTITQALDDSAREAGKPLSDDVLFHGGAAVVEELAEVAEAANIFDYSEEDLSSALALAVNMYRDKAIADGRTTKEQLVGEFEQFRADQGEGEPAATVEEAPNGGR